MCEMSEEKYVNRVHRIYKNDMDICNNRGSSTVEMCFIMPVIVIIIAATIFLFLYAIDDARHQGVGYVNLYAYRGSDEVIEGVAIGDGEISCAYSGEAGSYGIQRKCYIYSTEYGVRTGRLRRWQLYGDVLSEQGN